ncbi:MAG: enoyl-CoA hydratase/isomerase family protein [Alphaproteobacteria bacterium]|nr:enoyl-CoA hydratase/isomerase family protein [Alphaproteobacteria bacterium]
MGKTYETLLVEPAEPHILKVTLNRPQAANALNTQMGRDLLDLWLGLVLDPGEARCIVVTGAGGKAFCAGGDLKERNGMTDEAWQKQHAIFEQAVYRMMDVPVPIIGAINGAAYGGGCELALACDFAYAARSARFALTEVTLGIMPGAGGTQNLPRAVGVRRAKEIILTGQAFGAEEAYAWGMINKVCEDAELLDAVMATARRIAQNAPVSVRQAKRSVDVATQVDLKNGLAFEIEAYNRMVPTADRQEGIRAFNEKRRPSYTGR